MKYTFDRQIVVNVRDAMIDTFNFTIEQENYIAKTIKESMTKNEIEIILDGGRVDKVVKEIEFMIGPFNLSENCDVMNPYITLDILIFEKNEEMLDKLPNVWYN